MSVAIRRAAVLLAILVAVFTLGCQKKAEPPAATEGATNGGPANAALPDTAGTSVMTFRWEATGNCMSYSPSTVTMKVGGSMNFNNSSSQTVTITAPAGCFSAAETTFTVVRGPSPAIRAYSPGNYTLTTNPTTCSPKAGGGPAVVIDSGTK